MLFWLACSEAVVVETEEAFTERVQADLRKRLTRHTVERVDALQLRVEGPGGFENELHLDSLRARCVRSPDSCREATVAYVDRQGRLTAARAEPLMFSKLRPMLFDEKQARALELDHEPFVDGLVVVLVHEGEHNSRIVDAVELGWSDSSFDEAYELAMSQLGPMPGRAADRMLVASLWTDECVRPVASDLLLLDGEEASWSQDPTLSEWRYCWDGSTWVRQ